MQPAFLGMAIASGIHAAEEYIYPGGFLRWVRIAFPRSALGPARALLINAVFFALVLSPLWSTPRAAPVFSLSIAGLLLANGVLHIAGSLVTHRYSPGAVTSSACYFPSAIYAFVTLAPQWRMSAAQVAGAVLLGIGWQLLPLPFLLRREQG